MRGIFLSLYLCIFGCPVWAEIVVDKTDRDFHRMVQRELSLMRDGKRGLVIQALLTRLDEAEVTTTIEPLTRDNRTWHPNDRKGKRSHVVARDTKIRGGARTIPTATTLYLHPSRIDPKLSLFKLGTFVKQLALSMDLNSGTFSGDYKIREKRSTFYTNAWFDSLGYGLVTTSGRVPTMEYQQCKELNLISQEFVQHFPILYPDEFSITASEMEQSPTQLTDEEKTQSITDN